jgi:hypothetical protein
VGDKPRWETSVDLCLKKPASNWVSILKFLTFVLLVMRGALVVLSFFAGNGWFLVFYASHLGTVVVSVRSTQPTHTTLTLYEYKLS